VSARPGQRTIRLGPHITKQKAAQENIPRGLCILCPGPATGTATRYSAAMARGALL
jgi:hypothetical protein